MHTANDPTASGSLARNGASLIPDADTTLTSGWERQTDDGDTVLRNYAATLEDRLLTLAGATGAPTASTHTAFFVDLDSAYVFDNIVIPRGFLGPDDLATVVADARAFFPPQRAWTLQAFTPAADLTDHGLALLGHPPLMYLPANAAVRPSPAPVEIRPVETAAQLRDFQETLVQAYPLPHGSSVVRPQALDAGFRALVGYDDDRPVATAGCHTAHGLTEVEWVSTLPSHRGRGIGAALTHAASTVEPSVPAALVASDDGRHVYERLGYLALMRLSVWLHPAP